MIAYVNGRFVPEHEASVSVFDRGFLYGDGLFETVPVAQGRPFGWEEHMARLDQGLATLGIARPTDRAKLRMVVEDLLQRNQASDVLLRITISRGIGRRGYSPAGASQPTLVLTLHPAPAVDIQFPRQWRLVVSSFRVSPDDPLALVKSASRLLQVMARAEAEAQGADEALLLNTRGEATESSSGNIFWIESGALCTTPLASPALPGVTRGILRGLAASAGLSFAEERCPVARLQRADGVLVTLSSLGVVEVIALDGAALARSPRTIELHRAYQQLLAKY